jgi:hypothetical protein
MLADLWGQPIAFRRNATGTNNIDWLPEIYSAGPDKTFGTSDDLTSLCPRWAPGETSDMRSQLERPPRPGFTLIELVVIAIIAILASMLLLVNLRVSPPQRTAGASQLQVGCSSL